MDILSIVGVVLAVIAIVGGAVLKGSSAGALVGSAAFVIVVMGTLAASLVQTPMPTFFARMEDCQVGIHAAGQ